MKVYHCYFYYCILYIQYKNAFSQQKISMAPWQTQWDFNDTIIQYCGSTAEVMTLSFFQMIVPTYV